MTKREFLSTIEQYNPNYDMDIISKAYDVAEEMHRNQLRKSGEEYLIHPLAVAVILAELGMDSETIAAGLLHDVIEDTSYTVEDMTKDFGTEVTELVDGVTKLSALKFESKEERQAENLRKMFLAMSKDIRVLIIKLADRLHNLRTINYMTHEKIIEKCQETLDIYAPLAARLGIYSMKMELEDIALKFLDPAAYYDLAEQVSQRKGERESAINEVVEEISKALDEIGIKHETYGRSKHFYSIYKKMKYQHKNLDEIFDLMAVRIIVDTVRDCYASLGLVHTMWTPIPGRFKDYIAMPKPNMYQSIHTTVLGDNGEPFEIQIRTYEMHRIAEYGIAAHWKYKEGKVSGSVDDSEKKLAWLRQALEWQKEADDSVEFLNTVKVDLFDNQVFVFTPGGDVIELPAESTPLDFAFKIHTDVGIRCVGAKVNGKMVTIDHPLQNGDIVEIVTSANSSGPSVEWLKKCKTSGAKNKIRNWLRKADKDSDVSKGRTNINNYIKKKGYDPAAVTKNAYILRAVKDFNCSNVNELFLQISRGGSTVSKLGQKLIEYYEADNQIKEKEEEHIEVKKKPPTRPSGNSENGIVVKGADNLLIRRATCCNPVPGDPIIGYISKGKGITVHRTDCANIRNIREADRGRLIEVNWDSPNENRKYYADIQVVSEERKGLFKDISKVCDDYDLEVVGLNLTPGEPGTTNTLLTVEITDMHQIQRLLTALRQVEGVIKVFRPR